MKILLIEPSPNNVTEAYYPILEVFKDKYSATVDTVKMSSFDSVTFSYADKDKKKKEFHFYRSHAVSNGAHDIRAKIEEKFPMLLKKILLTDRHFGRNQFINEIHYVPTEDSTYDNEVLFNADTLNYLSFANSIITEGKYDLVFGSAGNFRADCFSLLADYFSIPFWEVFYSRIRGDQTDYRYLSNSYLKCDFLLTKSAYDSVAISNSSRKFLDVCRQKRSNSFLIYYKPKWLNVVKSIASDIKWFFKSKKRKKFFLDRFKNKLYFLMNYNYQSRILSKTILGPSKDIIKQPSALVALCQVPEIVLLGWAVKYISHVDYINKIFANLPSHWILNLREHPHNVGRRPFIFMEWVRSLRSTRLLSLDETQYAQILSSTVCITTNGTMGWEALLLRKPVISFADTFYDLTGLNYRITDYAQLNNIESIVNDFNKKSENEYDERLLRLISLDEQTCFSTKDRLSMEKIIALALKHPYSPFWKGR
jgi:hypothetical protein